MKRCAIFLAILLCIPTAILGMDEARFMTYPDISGDKIVFTYDDDLWLTNTQGAAPIRLTSHPGREFAARFSPDGKWIAFSGYYHGTMDVYLIPSEGGTPRRMTYFPGGAMSLGWTPDSRNIVFRSAWGRSPIGRDSRLYRVSIDGAAPDVLQDNDPASVMAGKDLQLEKALEVAMKKIKEEPFQFPPVPKYPKK